MEFLGYIFYRIYKFQFWVGNHLTPIGTTILGMTGLLMFNLFSVLGIISYLTGYYPLFFESSKITALIFFVVILSMFCYFFLRKNRYKIILKKYENEDKEKAMMGNIYVFLLVVFTLIFLYFSLYLLYLRNIAN